MRHGPNDASLSGERRSSVARDGHHDSVAVGPDGVERAVGRGHGVKAFEGAVVVAGQPRDAAQLNGLRPRKTAVGRAREKKVAGGEGELRPADIEVARMRPGGGGHYPGLVLEGDSGGGIVREDRDRFWLPRLASAKRPADGNSLSRPVVRPAVCPPPLLESSV